MVVKGYDDRAGCGYVVRTGRDLAAMLPGAQAVRGGGITVLATPEIAASLRDVLERHPVTPLTSQEPEVPLTLDDRTLLAWLRHAIGGVLNVSSDPGPDPRIRPA